MVTDDPIRPALRGAIDDYGGPWNRQRPGPPPGREGAGQVPTTSAPKPPVCPSVVAAVRAAGGSQQRGVLRSEIAEHYVGDDLDEALARATASGDLIYVPEAMGYLLAGEGREGERGGA